jgi:hypothetical protein
MYSDAAIRGPGGGHSARSPAGGLITAQSANDIVRDHRYTPSLLVRQNIRGQHGHQARPPDQQRGQQHHQQHREQHQPHRPEQRRHPEQEGRRRRTGRPPFAR